MNIFHPHGDYRLQLNQDVLEVTLIGAWNKEMAHLFINECKEAVGPLKGKPWGILADVEEFMLAVPEAVELGKDFIGWAAKNGCVRDAHVFSHSPVKEDLFKRMSLHTDGKQCKKRFDTLESARAWLEKGGLLDS